MISGRSHGVPACSALGGKSAKDIPWSSLQLDAIAYVEEATRRLKEERPHHGHGEEEATSDMHRKSSMSWDLPPRSPEQGSGRWLRDAYRPKPGESISVESKADEPPSVDNKSIGGVMIRRIQHNSIIAQRLAKASTVRQVASIASSQLLPPRSLLQLDQQEYEARIALDTLSVLIGARRLELEPLGGRRLSLRTR